MKSKPILALAASLISGFSPAAEHLQLSSSPPLPLLRLLCFCCFAHFNPFNFSKPAAAPLWLKIAPFTRELLAALLAMVPKPRPRQQLRPNKL